MLYYLHETNPDNGLVRDKTDPTCPCQHRRRRHGPGDDSGRRRARRAHPQSSPRRSPAADSATCSTCPQGPEPDAAGYKGFFYHFLDIETGRRVWECELSTIDSAFLFAGVLDRRHLLRRATRADEAEIRRLADDTLPPGRLELGPRRRSDAHARLAAGDRVHPAPLRRLRRGTAALHARPGLADASAAAGELRRLLRDLPVEEDLRPRVALLRAALHPPALAPVDRLSRHPRRLHARRAAATTSRTAGRRPSCSRSTRSAIR